MVTCKVGHDFATVGSAILINHHHKIRTGVFVGGSAALWFSKTSGRRHTTSFILSRRLECVHSNLQRRVLSARRRRRGLYLGGP